MADYEVLAPGGHARLVSDVKSYADRAGGKGTTQLADGSVTRDKLADGVTDRIDAMHDRCDPLVGNHFFGELAEGTVLTADDAYAAPPKNVEVYGKSTQVVTTGKNLLNLANVIRGYFYVSDTTIRGEGTSIYAPVVDGTTYTISGGNGNRRIVAFTTELPAVGVAIFGCMIPSGTSTPYTFTAPDNAQYVVAYVDSSSTLTPSGYQIEQGTTATSYEPYTGGKPSPSPDYPQEIKSVDDLTLNVCGKNLLPKSVETSRTYRGVTFSTSGNGEVVISGTFTLGANDVSAPYGTAGFGINTNYFPYVTIQENYSKYIPAGTYTFSAIVTNRAGTGGIALVIGDIGQSINTGASFRRVTSGETPQTFTTTGGYAMFVVGTAGDNIATVDVTISNIQLEYGSTATSYQPYVGQSVEIPLSDHSLRSLPDGTRDTLTLTYQGPSEREGWAVYGASLVQRAGTVDMGTLTWSMSANYFYANISDKRGELSSDIPNVLLCTEYQVEPVTVSSNNLHDGFVSEMYGGTNRGVILKNSNYTTAADLKASLSGAMLQYLLATPITHDLGTVELPVLPNPMTAWTDGGSAQPTMSMNYEQDINIVIARLEAAIADLATA